MELARSLELRSGAYRAPALPVELCQPELARRFECRSRTYEARALPTELHQHKTSLHNSGGGGENCTPDDLLCRETPCCLGYTASNILTNLERKAGLEPALSFLACPEKPSEARCRMGWQRRVLAARPLPLWGEQRELNSRHRVGGPRHQPLYHARLDIWQG